MPLRFAFLLFEEHPWGREMLRGLIERGYEPELIVQEISEVAAVEREKLLARMGGQCIAPRVVEQVRERVIPVWYVHNLNSDFCGELLAADPPDLLVMGGARIARETILDVPRIATLNAHPGLLPTLRGTSTVGWALYKDLPQGVSIHFVDTHIDEGDIILRRDLPVRCGDTYEQINGRLAVLAGEMMAETLGYFERGAVPRTPQDRTQGETLREIPGELLAEGKRRLSEGTYSHFAREA
jgi:methionyl-tRNA formyltransferase